MVKEQKCIITWKDAIYFYGTNFSVGGYSIWIYVFVSVCANRRGCSGTISDHSVRIDRFIFYHNFKRKPDNNKLIEC